MNKLKSTMLIGVGVATVGLTGVGVANTSYAMNGSHKADSHIKIDYRDSFDARLSTKLASEFNLDKSEVQTVIDEVRQEQKDATENRYLIKLDQALENEKITQDQYDYIKSQITELKTLRDSLREESKSERKETLRDMRSTFNELRKWMKEENISIRALGFEFHQGYGHISGSYDARR